MGSASTEDAYCLKWNDFHTSITSSFATLRSESDLLDAVIVCEGQQLLAHRLVLSACSGVFKSLFRMSSVTSKSENPVVLLWDVKVEDLKLLLNFMYEGQVNVGQDNLTAFLALAEKLQVRGLTNSDNNRNGSSGTPSSQNAASKIRAQAKTQLTSTSGRRARSNLLGSSSAPKRPRPHVEDSSADDEDISNPLPVKQELKVDENSTVDFDSSTADPTSGPSSSFNSSKNFSGLYGNNPDDEDPAGLALPSPHILEDGAKELYFDENQETDDWQDGQASAGEMVLPTLGSGSRPQGCPYCGKELRNMTRHIEDVHCPVEIACQYCGKICTSRNKLRTHQAQVCNKRFLLT